ncbi:MAG: DNA repair protein RecO [Legionellaceae bacterium]|nr:DNA repair protein RecO [Legionellaceae bacterium]
MSITSHNAWLIHKKWFGDSSAYITFYTREKGLISSFCRGARTNKMQSILQQFNYLWVNFTEKPNRFYVNKVELAAPALQLVGDRLYAGLYLNELLYYALQPLDENQQLFDLYEKTLRDLQFALDNISLEILLRRFEIGFLTAIGYGLVLTHDAKSLEPIKENNQYKYIPSVGLVTVERGISGAHIDAIADDNFESREVLQVTKKIMRVCIDHFLDGREIKTRSLYSASK